MLFAYTFSSAEQNVQLKEVVKDEFSDERIEKHFILIIDINNILKLK